MLWKVKTFNNQKRYAEFSKKQSFRIWRGGHYLDIAKCHRSISEKISDFLFLKLD